MANGHMQNAQPVTLEGGEYDVHYEGLGTGVQEFILTVYGTCMPMLNLTSQGQDIERFYPQEDAKRKSAQSSAACI
jgi:AraC family transcriptional activator of mar-sox-rob regulon